MAPALHDSPRMSRLAVTVLVVVALGACTKRGQDFAWFAAAVAVEVIQVNHEIEAEREAARSRAVAVAYNPDDAPGPSQADLQRAHDVAWELTKIAAHDARAENCEAVVRTSNHVRVIDPNVFANVFLKDVEIQRCLALTP